MTVLARVHVSGLDMDPVSARQPGTDAHDPVHAREQRTVRVAQLADVRDLAAGLDVERRAVERDVAVSPLRRCGAGRRPASNTASTRASGTSVVV